MLAFSTDGINWTKHPSPVLDVSDSSWDSHNNPIGSPIGIAVFADGISFLRRDTAPILRPGPSGSWGELFIESPRLYMTSLPHQRL